ncbi:MAG: hypothetical protein Q9157_001519 [Trypethelium eluteriae]
MFQGEQNPGYFGMGERAKKIVAGWCPLEWLKDVEIELGSTSTRETTPTTPGVERRQSSKMPLKRMNTDASITSESRTDGKSLRSPAFRRSTSEAKTSRLE